jgi:type IX secretion system PorP/SprF family membrane protein
MKKRWLILMILYLLIDFSLSVYAQSDICMTTHWNNRANYNPAFIARTDYIYLFTNARHQWLGVNGAPKVFNIQASEYIHNMHSAIGISLIGDIIGVTQVYNPMAIYAYRMVQNNTSISFGLAAGTYSRSIDGNQYEADVINDPSINYTNSRIIRPDANAGVEIQNEHFIFGLSSTHLFSLTMASTDFTFANHRYGYIMYKNNNPELFYYKVGILITNRNNLIMAEGNVFIRIKHPTGLLSGPRELFEAGLSLRTSKQIAILAGIMLTPDLRVGYAFEHSFITGYNNNSTHELMIEYRIFSKYSSTRARCGDNLYWYH